MAPPATPLPASLYAHVEISTTRCRVDSRDKSKELKKRCLASLSVIKNRTILEFWMLRCQKNRAQFKLNTSTFLSVLQQA